MSVERYALDTGEMEVHRNGGYVLHADYEELERYGRQADITIENLELKLAESQRELRAADATIENLQMQVEKLAAENAGLKESRKNLAEFIHEELDAGYPLNMDVETPDTDAFLAEVRAQGVEMFADDLLCPDLDSTIREFAEQLRKGVQS